MNRQRVTLVAVLLFLSFACSSRPNTAKLQDQAAAAIEAINAFKQAQGRWPRSLDEVSVIPPKNEFGNWEYQVLMNGDCELSIGDYSRDSFCLAWNSRDGWYLDD